MAEFNEDLTLGKTTHESIWPDLCRSVGEKIDITLLRRAFESTPMNSEAINLARELKHLYQIGIITDNKADRIHHLRHFQALDDIFKPIVVSAEIGMSNSEPKIFLYTVNQLGIKPSESIFVDNNRKNLTAPKSLGMKTVFHDDKDNDLVALRRNIDEAIHASVSEA